MNNERVFFMIESDKALDLVKQYIADVRRVRDEVTSLVEEIGAERYMISQSDGRLTRVDFGARPRHPDFKVPDKYGCYPKKGTQWAQRFNDQKGHELASTLIAETLSVPLSINYNQKGGSGSRRIGYPLNECGFLYLGEKGPYAMWVPDVPAEVAADVARGLSVDEPARSFLLQFEGCRQITIEEWQLLVAQHNVEKMKARAAA
ncbi:hypothetical protein R70006_06246 [Paraburkholderia domus]|uniref:hypothetical protein n=1 Tax=Paraburkholderia domus TaxID=2793075 RepID=UPI0019139E74|nr:hypothetical protein [Paraburkholderia domus]MBK5052877.1 hypothetical protein [Burkholderia sp. R-70006]CAE6821998.1 hypothetical protein R70006_06246 [Paraburkholderia domus]